MESVNRKESKSVKTMDRKKRDVARAKLTDLDQLKKLNMHNYTATKERTRLCKRLKMNILDSWLTGNI